MKKNDDYIHWNIDISLIKTPVVIFEVWKILILSTCVVPALLFIIDLAEGNFEPILLYRYLKMYLLIVGIMTMLLVFSYYAVFIPIVGSKYGLTFKMDDKGIDHIVRNHTKDKSRLVGYFTIVAGVALGSPTTAGSGMLANFKQNMYTPFKKVKKIICFKKRNIIKLICSDYSRNIIFVHSGDRAKVLKHISENCKKANVKIKNI